MDGDAERAESLLGQEKGICAGVMRAVGTDLKVGVFVVICHLNLKTTSIRRRCD